MLNSYIPKVVRIARASQETRDIKTFSLNHPLVFSPGQFLAVTCFGVGEAPISISSGPDEKFLKISFKRMGSVSAGLFGLKENDSLGIRGPFGKGFPLEQLEGRDLLVIAGGIGIAPLRSLLKSIISDYGPSRKIGNITLLYGSRTPGDILYKKDLVNWEKYIEVAQTVDAAGPAWNGRVGLVTQLLNEVKIDPPATKALLCGPEIMMRFATARLLELGMHPQDIMLSLERHMQCGAGKCGHCYIGDKFVCRDGPVFTCAELNNLIPAQIL